MIADQRQAPGFANVDPVTEACCSSLEPEAGIAHINPGRPVDAAENRELIVVEEGIAQCEITALVSDARAVGAAHFCARELQVFDQGVLAVDNPDAFAVGYQGVRVKVCKSAGAAYREIILVPDRVVVQIQARVY